MARQNCYVEPTVPCKNRGFPAQSPRVKNTLCAKTVHEQANDGNIASETTSDSGKRTRRCTVTEKRAHDEPPNFCSLVCRVRLCLS